MVRILAPNDGAGGTPGHLFSPKPHRSYMRLSREEGVESKLSDHGTAYYYRGP